MWFNSTPVEFCGFLQTARLETDNLLLSKHQPSAFLLRFSIVTDNYERIQNMISGGYKPAIPDGRSTCETLLIRLFSRIRFVIYGKQNLN